ncbi:MAG: hypothetical protein ACRD0U_08540 [Acidimicrobiales bacterium]
MDSASTRQPGGRGKALIRGRTAAAVGLVVLLTTLPLRWVTVTYYATGSSARRSETFTGIDILTKDGRAVDGLRSALTVLLVAAGLAVLALVTRAWLHRLIAWLGAAAALISVALAGQGDATDRPYVISDHTYVVGTAGVVALVLAAGLIAMALARGERRA